MAIPLLVAAILVLAGAADIGWMLHSMRRRRSELERRASLLGKAGEKRTALEPLLAPPATGTIAGFIKSFFTFGAGYSWGMNASASLLVASALIPASALWVLTVRGFGLPIWLATVISACGAFLWPRGVLHRQQQRARRKFTDLFPDTVEMVARMLRAGAPITFAIQAVGKEAPPPVNKVFTIIADQIRIGIPVADALDMSSKLVALPDFRFFAVAAIMQYSTGGNLVATLEDLSLIMRKRQAARLKAKAVSAEIRFSAYVLGSLPILVVGALFVIDPDYLAPLINDPRGHLILSLAGGGLLLSFITMRLMIRSVGRE